ncbi:hypothetical protein WJX81_003743 [Elliptochloris bilobata]|uniref:PRA1 family protein n=1 Tax=Elliptochloris bilobata TaxID=381761 RepID=A0AAW1RD32_9CHLO
MGARPMLVAAEAAALFREVVGSVFKERKPWSELFDRTAFSRPASVAEATQRLRKNAAYFRINYLILMLCVTFITLLLNPTSLLVLGFLTAGWSYLFVVRTAPIVIGGRTFSEKEKLIGASGVSVLVVFFLTSIGVILATALGISVAAVALHGSLRTPDDLFTDEIEGQNGGLLGLFNPPRPTNRLNVV